MYSSLLCVALRYFALCISVPGPAAQLIEVREGSKSLGTIFGVIPDHYRSVLSQTYIPVVLLGPLNVSLSHHWVYSHYIVLHSLVCALSPYSLLLLRPQGASPNESSHYVLPLSDCLHVVKERLTVSLVACLAWRSSYAYSLSLSSGIP